MYNCMICAGTRALVKCGEIVLCERCVTAIYRELRPKIRRKKREKKVKSPKIVSAIELSREV